MAVDDRTPQADGPRAGGGARRALKWTLGIVGGLLLLIVVAVAGVLVWLRTDAGRDFVVAQAEAASPGLDIQGLSGLPFHPRVDRLTMADREGVWLTVEGIDLNLRARDLLARTVSFERVAAARVAVERAPVAEEDPPPEEETGPASLPVGVEIDRLEVPRIELGAALLGGAPAVLAAEGSAVLPAGELGGTARLAVARIDEHPGRADLDATFVPHRRLDLDLRVAEPANGVVAGLLGIEGRPPVTVTLAGTGPLEDWKGRLEARAGEAVSVVADAGIRALQGRYALDLKARGAIAPLLPEAQRPLAGDAVTVEAAGTLVPGERAEIDRAQVQAAAGRLAARGGYGLADGAMDLAFDLAAGPDSPLHALAPEPVWTSLSLTGTMRGTADRPQLNARLTVDGAGFGQVTADRLALDIATDPQARDVLGFSLNAALEGVRATDPALSELVGGKPTLAAAGSLNRTTGDVRLDRLALDAFAAKLAGEATVGGWGRTADAALTFTAAELARLGAALGQPGLKGEAKVEATLAKRGEDLDASLRADAGRLATGIPAADALLGGTARLTAKVARQGEETRVRDLALTGANLAATGEATLKGEALTARLDGRVADLAPLGIAVGTPLAGAARLEVAARGPTADLAATATLTSDGMRVQEEDFGPTRIVADLQGLPASPRGTLDGRATVEGRPLTLAAKLDRKGDRLSVRDLVFALANNRITGALDADLAATTATGRLRADLPDLGPLGALAGQDLDGRASADLRLEAPKGRQSAALDLTVRDLVQTLPDGVKQAVERLSLRARADDALKAPKLDARLEVARALVGGGRLDGVTATVAGPLSEARFTLGLGGEMGKPLRLDAAGTLSSTDKGDSILLTRLEGQYDGTALRQTGRALFASGPKGVRVEGLRLATGQARIALDAALDGDDLSGRAELSRVPMSLVRLVDPTLALQGEVNGTASLAGSRADPRGDLTLTLTALRADGVGLGPDAGVDGRLTAAWRGGRMQATARAEGRRGNVDLTARVEAPLVLEAGAAAPAVPPGGLLAGGVKGRMDMAALNDLLAASGDRVAGALSVDLALSGTVDKPGLAGTVAIDKGRYENQMLGTVVESIEARLSGSQEGLSIQRFEGTTPGGGRVAVGGAIRLDPAWGDRQIEMTVSATNARLVRMDPAQAWADADLSFNGSFERASLAGRVRVRKAYIGIPEKLPPQVADLQVVAVRNGVPVDPEQTMVALAEQEAPGMVIALAVAVEAENQIYVQGRGLDAEFKADLDVAGTTDEPAVTGEVSLVKGELSALGETFELAKASVTFDGTTDPLLDIQARRERTGFVALVNITGRPSEPKLELSSEPPVPEDEILARILFDRSIGELSALEAVQLAQSAAQLTGFLGSGPGVMDKVKRSLGVDRLEFKGSESGEGPGTVAAGRYVGSDLYVGVENELGTGQSKVTAEYEATDTIKLRGEVGRDSEIGVQFEWDY